MRSRRSVKVSNRKLQFANPSECNHATLGGYSATSCATVSQLGELKRLALLVIERNRACNLSATWAKKLVQLEAEFVH